MSSANSDRTLSRRRFLWLAGATGGLVVVGCSPVVSDPSAPGARAPLPPRAGTDLASIRPGKWSDPATWGGRVPGSTDNAQVRHDVQFDQTASVAGAFVAASGALVFAPATSVTLTSPGNLIVEGHLVMSPAGSQVHHEISFTGIDERNFVGGGMDPVPTDVGLWVMGDGVLDLAGTPKVAWARSVGDVPAGARVIELDADPVGWQVGDEIVLTPTAPPTAPNHSLAYDTGTVAAVAGRQVTISAPTANAHPAVTLPDGTTLGTEVLNISRNVRVGGTPSGRTHIFVRSTQPQSVRNVVIRYVGPRRPDPADPKYTTFVLGRYGLHLHMCDQGSVGSVVEGTVVRDAGSHAFVPHLSDGVTFTRCISHNTFEVPYWWDQRPAIGQPGPPTNGTVYDHCVASLVQTDPSFRGYRLAGFSLNDGTGNECRHCVAVGVQGNKDASGFHWPEGGQGVWMFHDCVAHNNAVNGTFTWQNTGLPHVVQRLVAFHNGSAGIAHGAYINGYRYEDCILLSNGSCAIRLDAVSRSSPQLAFLRTRCEDRAGLSTFAVRTARHSLASGGATRFEACSFAGYRQAALGLAYGGDNGPTTPDLIDLIDCTFGGNELYVDNATRPGSVVRFSDAVRGIIAARPLGESGTPKPEWNACVEPIPAFA